MRSGTLDDLALDVLHPPAAASGAGGWRMRFRTVDIVQTIEHPDATAAATQAATDAASGADGLVIALEGTASARGFGVPLAGVARVLTTVGAPISAIRVEVPSSLGAEGFAQLLGSLEDSRKGSRTPHLDLALDPLGDVARTGRFDPDAATLADTWLNLAVPHGAGSLTLRADGRPHHEAGASDAQELAAVLSAGVFYLRASEKARRPDARPAFTLAADIDHLLMVAKFRAFRRLWALVEDACGLVPRPAVVHAETSWRMLSRADPWTNVIRATLACVGAILGGADSVTVLPFTAALGLPDAAARRLARNTPLILREECGLTRVVDPAAGSGTFEAWTDALCRDAWRVFQDLEGQGGLARVLHSGIWQRTLREASESRRTAFSTGEATLVGVTAFAPPGEAAPSVLARAGAQAHDAASGPAHLALCRDAESFEHGPAAGLSEEGDV